MSDITTFKFNKDNFSKIREYRFGLNWPVVYVLENGKEIYIGESTNVYNRSKQHSEKEDRRRLEKIHIISDEEFNKSATLDIESMLIEYIAADEKFIVQNGNKGLKNHDYFDREKYQSKFEVLWGKMIQMDLAQKSILEIRNSQIFKYSPYKVLTEDQVNIADEIKDLLKNNVSNSIIVEGGPGTGKTILATYLIKNITETKKLKHLKIGFVVPMSPLRGTIQKVFSKIKGLKAGMVIGPNDVVKEEYDLLVVDEAHRLRQRKNIVNMKSFDDINKGFKNRGINFESEGNELDWILNSSKHQIFFYDKNQSVRPADIGHSRFAKMDAIRLQLTQQKRVKGGERYIRFIQNTLDLEPSECNFEDYDFKIFDNISDMVSAIKEKNEEYELCRVVAGYAWPWKTNKGGEYDIEIDGLKMIWNSTTKDWVNSPNSINEVGCIHTVQGYDLNYTGVIIGPEISYNPETHEIIIDKNKYQDINGKKSVTDPEELKFYIINIYKTLLTRGIYGTYVYVVDENLRRYMQESLGDLIFT
jgi:DUF2075 family protein/DNA replication protein DnaC